MRIVSSLSVFLLVFSCTNALGEPDPECAAEEFLSTMREKDIVTVDEAQVQARMGDTLKCNVRLRIAGCVKKFKDRVENYRKFHEGEGEAFAPGTYGLSTAMEAADNLYLNMTYKYRDGNYLDVATPVSDRAAAAKLQSIFSAARQACSLSTVSDEQFDKKMTEILRSDTHNEKRRKILLQSCLEDRAPGENYISLAQRCESKYGRQ